VTLPVPIERGARSALATTICNRVARAAYSAIEARQRFVMCIAGGSVAESCLPLIANSALPWPQVDIIWADERAVPVADPESNAGTAAKLWAGSALEVLATIHPMVIGLDDPAIAAQNYERELIECCGEAPVIDFALLGVGEDGHIASLFPGHAALTVTDRLVVAEFDSPKPPSRRVSLTLPFLSSAREIIVAGFGAGKEAALVAATTDATATTPVAMLIRSAAIVTVMRDE
jgi:6-phosphogluconolactonase